jgi:hypothetical protein
VVVRHLAEVPENPEVLVEILLQMRNPRTQEQCCMSEDFHLEPGKMTSEIDSPNTAKS